MIVDTFLAKLVVVAAFTKIATKMRGRDLTSSNADKVLVNESSWPSHVRIEWRLRKFEQGMLSCYG